MTISTIVQSSTTVTSNYFAYGKHGYYIANIGGPDNPAPGKLIPGYAYWVKTNGAGTLTMNGNVEAAPKASVAPVTNLASLNTVTVTDRMGRTQTLYIGNEDLVKEPLTVYELPPQAPEFDVRFTSGRMLETGPATLDAKASYAYGIDITTEATSYPLTVSWNIQKNAGRAMVLSTPDGKSLGNT